MDWVNSITQIVIALLTVLGGLWAFAMWLTRRFKEVTDLVFKKTEEILNKLEYHERHDDRRFAAVTDDLWTIRLENASRHNQNVFPRNKAPLEKEENCK